MVEPVLLVSSLNTPDGLLDARQGKPVTEDLFHPHQMHDSGSELSRGSVRPALPVLERSMSLVEPSEA